MGFSTAVADGETRLTEQGLAQRDSLEFIRFAIAAGVLRFGEFKTKAGRMSPYFFNAGLFHDGALLGRIAEFYAQALLAAERAGSLRFDMLFGPAYKGITLASATAVALARHERNVGFTYNRKEAKDHGEGGNLIGAPLAGRVVIVDDVISAGTSVRESVEIITHAGATPAAVLIALDRRERGGTADYPTERSAVQEVRALYGIPVISIASLDDVLAFLESGSVDAAALAEYRDKVSAYRARYGAPAEA
jgi:orotate phosphoribosyltransferase